jgi:hypothetical protein
MEPGDLVTAPQGWRGVREDAVYVGPAPNRAERDRSDGSILEFPQVRVRFTDGNEVNVDEAFVKSRK